jgi:hypothetical protein
MKKDNTMNDNAVDKMVSYLAYFSEKNKWVSDDCLGPILDYSDEIDNFMKDFYDTKFWYNFKWSEWEEGREYIKNPELISELDITTLRMLLTSIMRAERFSDGVLLDNIENGVIKNILFKLKEIKE